jgi:hypothetical protein
MLKDWAAKYFQAKEQGQTYRASMYKEQHDREELEDRQKAGPSNAGRSSKARGRKPREAEEAGPSKVTPLIGLLLVCVLPRPSAGWSHVRHGLSEASRCTAVDREKRRKRVGQGATASESARN